MCVCVSVNFQWVDITLSAHWSVKSLAISLTNFVDLLCDCDLSQVLPYHTQLTSVSTGVLYSTKLVNMQVEIITVRSEWSYSGEYSYNMITILTAM